MIFQKTDYIHPNEGSKGLAGFKKTTYAYLVSEGFTISCTTVNMMRRVAHVAGRDWVTVEDAMQVQDTNDICLDSDSVL